MIHRTNRKAGEWNSGASSLKKKKKKALNCVCVYAELFYKCVHKLYENYGISSVKTVLEALKLHKDDLLHYWLDELHWVQ